MPNQDRWIYKVYTDGGSRGNPGPAAYGYVIYGPQGNLFHESKQYLGVATNNQAEYQGLVAALRYLQTVEFNPQDSIECYSDSQLMVRQINGQYRVKNDDLKAWIDEIQLLKAKLPIPIIFIDVRREHNSYADGLVNAALDEVNDGN